MNYRFWTRIAAASLIILGDGVFASELSSRTNTEIGVNSDTIQIAHSIAQDKPEPKSVHADTSSNPSHTVGRLTYITLAVTTASLSHSPKYKSFIPRAPPASI